MIKKLEEEVKQPLTWNVIECTLAAKIDELIDADRHNHEAIGALAKNQQALLARIKALEDAVVLMAGGKDE